MLAGRGRRVTAGAVSLSQLVPSLQPSYAHTLPGWPGSHPEGDCVEFFFELLLEFIGQIVTEILCELGLHAMKEPFRRPPNPWFAGIGYALFGALTGIASLFIFPHHMVTLAALRWVNVIVTPLATGAVMAMLGAQRARHGQPVLRIDRFWYSYLFALVLVIVRFAWAN